MLKLELYDEKAKKKAMRAVSGLEGRQASSIGLISSSAYSLFFFCSGELILWMANCFRA